jgi:hypothetical protein
MGVTAWMCRFDSRDASIRMKGIARWLLRVHAGINVVLPLVKIPNKMLTGLFGKSARPYICDIVHRRGSQRSEVTNKKMTHRGTPSIPPSDGPFAICVGLRRDLPEADPSHPDHPYTKTRHYMGFLPGTDGYETRQLGGARVTTDEKYAIRVDDEELATDIAKWFAERDRKYDYYVL